MRGLRHATVGIELAVSVIVGFLLGDWLDKRFETDPWLTITFVVLGFVAGFRSLIRLARQAARDTKAPGDESNNDTGVSNQGEDGS